jgi:hypothetical protein
MSRAKNRKLCGAVDTSNEEFLISILSHIAAEPVPEVPVGIAFGQEVSQSYREFFNLRRLSPEYLPGLIFEVSYKTGGGFMLYRTFEGGVVMQSTRCPLPGALWGNAGLCEACKGCVAGVVADNTGYAKVHLAKSLMRGFKSCLMVVYFEKTKKTGLEVIKPGFLKLA